MSRASAHPVTCCRTDLGCEAFHLPGKFDAIRANEAGWFHSKAEDLAYCPEHVPDWVPAWRAEQAKLKFEVSSTYSYLPAVLRCDGCGLEETEENPVPDLVKALHARAFQHGRETGHRVTVITSHALAVEPAGEK